MQVLQFAVDEPGFDPQSIEQDCLCYSGTHDNDTTRGWFHANPDRDVPPSKCALLRVRASFTAFDLPH